MTDQCAIVQFKRSKVRIAQCTGRVRIVRRTAARYVSTGPSSVLVVIRIFAVIKRIRCSVNMSARIVYHWAYRSVKNILLHLNKLSLICTCMHTLYTLSQKSYCASVLFAVYFSSQLL